MQFIDRKRGPAGLILLSSLSDVSDRRVLISEVINSVDTAQTPIGELRVLCAMLESHVCIACSSYYAYIFFKLFYNYSQNFHLLDNFILSVEMSVFCSSI